MRKPNVSHHRPMGVGFLYAIRSGEYVKIGLSCELVRRMKELSTGNPHPMRVEMCRAVDREYLYVIEREIHRLLEQQHHHGEWFSASVSETRNAVAKAFRRARTIAGRDVRALGVCQRVGARGQRVYRNDITGEDFGIV